MVSIRVYNDQIDNHVSDLDTLNRLIEDSTAFCCSFQGDKPVSKAGEEDGDGDGGSAAQQDQTMQSAQSEPKEVSSFDVPDIEMSGSAAAEELKQVQNEELDKERDEILELRKELTQKYEPLRIDMVGVRLFFDKLQSI